MWQWYCRCMCLILTNGFYVFLRLSGQASPIPQVQRPERASTKTFIKNEIHEIRLPVTDLITSLLWPRLQSDKPKE